MRLTICLRRQVAECRNVDASRIGLTTNQEQQIRSAWKRFLIVYKLSAMVIFTTVQIYGNALQRPYRA